MTNINALETIVSDIIKSLNKTIEESKQVTEGAFEYKHF